MPRAEIKTPANLKRLQITQQQPDKSRTFPSLRFVSRMRLLFLQCPPSSCTPRLASRVIPPLKPFCRNRDMHVPCNRNVSVPLRACMCNSARARVPTIIAVHVVRRPLLSAPSPCVSGTLRTRGLPLAVHISGQGDRGLSKIIQVGHLAFEKVHSHIEMRLSGAFAALRKGFFSGTGWVEKDAKSFAFRQVAAFAFLIVRSGV